MTLHRVAQRPGEDGHLRLPPRQRPANSTVTGRSSSRGGTPAPGAGTAAPLPVIPPAAAAPGGGGAGAGAVARDTAAGYSSSSAGEVRSPSCPSAAQRS